MPAAGYGISLWRRGLFSPISAYLCETTKRRAQLTTASVVQFIKYDEHGQKVNKLVWDDHLLNPMEVIEAIWQEVPDFKESYELPDGLSRQNVPAFDEVVVRELLVNALVRWPYTQRSDTFLNLHPDRLEVVNPGLLFSASPHRTCCTPPCAATSIWLDFSTISG
ncbi:hypothetical protein ACTJKE_33065 [Ensifer sp. 22521]|uniref:hypothetical protein n=1 Tax=Ensifer sp. 22521 TaxID=3453935 RepID=UPI003F828483